MNSRKVVLSPRTLPGFAVKLGCSTLLLLFVAFWCLPWTVQVGIRILSGGGGAIRLQNLTPHQISTPKPKTQTLNPKP